MDAIEIALRASGIGPGDEVITTPMTAFATVLAILRAGATPVLADIEPDSGLLSLRSTRQCISANTRAVVLVHLYGQLRQMNEWIDLCQQNGIVLIEDCAQSHLAKWRGHVAGSFGLAGAYSFYPTKNLGAAGDAGMLVTKDADLAHRASQLRNYGQSVRYQHPEIGLNSRLDEIHAAMLAVRLQSLQEYTERRQVIAERYRSGFSNPRIKQLADPEEPGAHVYHLFVVRCDKRDALQAHLHENEIQSLIHYPIPIQSQKPCLGIDRDPAGLTASVHHAATCLSIPCHPQMTDTDVDSVINAVNAFQD
jgi:dTDP-4-amino-4,6-dideoxygalactose transaminase